MAAVEVVKKLLEVADIVALCEVDRDFMKQVKSFSRSSLTMTKAISTSRWDLGLLFGASFQGKQPRLISSVGPLVKAGGRIVVQSEELTFVHTEFLAAASNGLVIRKIKALDLKQAHFLLKA